ncbi:MAG: DUF1446 domain-containing protein [Sphingobacteriales bacterium JAD_PAG50586_3]|nr:MAG: DUF1446 domain-containing protein [Sphingobacteriales bacterium JAD_PAG50586_3]
MSDKQQPIRIAGAQGFYGDSPMAAMNIVAEKGADYLVHDALSRANFINITKRPHGRPTAWLCPRY